MFRLRVKKPGTSKPQDWPAPKNPRYQSLDFWRGVACLSVVIHHSTVYAADHGAGSAKGLASQIMAAASALWIGVPVFFVISGYCISATIESARRRPRPTVTYFARRFHRIYPPYWCILFVLVMIVPLVNCFTGSSISEIPTDFKPSSLTASQWFGNLTLTETWRYHWFGAPPKVLLGPAWTLCHEEQFYFVAGVLLLVMPRQFFAGAAAITLLVLGLYVAPWTGKENALLGSFLGGSWLMFAAGILVYFMVNHCSNRMQIAAGYAVLVAGIALTAGDSLRLGQASGDFELFVALCFALAISFLHRWDQQVISTKVLWPVTLCGKMCYSLYLVHHPLVLAASHYLYRRGANDARSTLLITIPICTTLSVLAGALFYFAVERFFVNSRNVLTFQTRSPATEFAVVPCATAEEPVRS